MREGFPSFITNEILLRKEIIKHMSKSLENEISNSTQSIIISLVGGVSQ